MRRRNDVMQSQRFADDLFHRHSRIERRIWILKNDLRFAPESAQFLLAKCENAAPLEPDVARHWFDQPQYQASDRRFAATGFTDQRKRGAGLHAQVDPIHRFDGCEWAAKRRAAGDKMPGQGFDFQQGAHGTPSSGALTHRDQCLAPTSTTGGARLTHVSLLKGQRGAKRQPWGIALMSGSDPSIVASVSTRRSRRGMEARRPIV